MILVTQQRRGFSLIEALVAVAVVGLLIALLLPALGAARRSAVAAQCLSHHRSLATAASLYNTEHHQYFPQPFQDSGLGSRREAAVWFNALDPYLGQVASDGGHGAAARNYNVFKQDPVYTGFGENTGVTGGNGSRTIKMNVHFGNFGDAPAVDYFKTTSLPHPSKTVVFFDGTSRDMGLDIDSSANTSFHGDESRVFIRHRGAANVAFADAHASLEKQETQTGSIGSVPYRSWFDEPDSRQGLVWDFNAP